MTDVVVVGAEVGACFASAIERRTAIDEDETFVSLTDLLLSVVGRAGRLRFDIGFSSFSVGFDIVTSAVVVGATLRGSKDEFGRVSGNKVAELEGWG